MKKQDCILILCVAAVLAPFFIPATGFYKTFEYLTNEHPFLMSFAKFAILSTLGEMIGLRISKGVYYVKGFGFTASLITIAPSSATGVVESEPPIVPMAVRQALAITIFFDISDTSEKDC